MGLTREQILVTNNLLAAVKQAQDGCWEWIDDPTIRLDDGAPGRGLLAVKAPERCFTCRVRAVCRLARKNPEA